MANIDVTTAEIEIEAGHLAERADPGADAEVYLPRSVAVMKLWPMMEQWVSEAGYELAWLELATDREGAILRIYIDHKGGPHGLGSAFPSVTIDDCTAASRNVSQHLDILEDRGEDPMPGRYRLEVSSPGIFRPLSRRWHLEAATGTAIKLKTAEKLQGRRSFQGQLVAVLDDRLELETTNARFSVPRDALAIVTWNPPL